MRPPWITLTDPNPVTSALVRHRGDTHRKEGPGNMEAETGLMQSQAKECQPTPEAEEAFSSAFGGTRMHAKSPYTDQKGVLLSKKINY